MCSQSSCETEISALKSTVDLLMKEVACLKAELQGQPRTSHSATGAADEFRCSSLDPIAVSRYQPELICGDLTDQTSGFPIGQVGRGGRGGRIGIGRGVHRGRGRGRGGGKVFTALRIMLQQPVFQLLPHCHPHCRLARLAAPLVILLQVCLMLSPIHHIHHNIILQVLLYSTLYVHHHPSNQESHKHQNLAMLDNHHHNHLQ